MKKTILAIVVLSSIVMASDNPVEIKYNKFWWKVTKESAVNTAKSIEIKIDKEACKESAIDIYNKAKDVTSKAIDKVKEKVEVQSKIKSTDTGNPVVRRDEV